MAWDGEAYSRKLETLSDDTMRLTAQLDTIEKISKAADMIMETESEEEIVQNLRRMIESPNMSQPNPSSNAVQLSLFDKMQDSETNRFISYYKLNGSFESRVEFTTQNLEGIHGMMVRCTMKNGDIHEGFADSYGAYDRSKYTGEIHDLIYLWTWDNFDEETRSLIGDMDTKFNQTYVPVKIADIESIDAIMYSNPRWGARLCNHFFIDVSKASSKGE